jgi:hypothetical protein
MILWNKKTLFLQIVKGRIKNTPLPTCEKKLIKQGVVICLSMLGLCTHLPRMGGRIRRNV